MPQKSPGKIRAVIFDLGKVVCHFNFEPAFRKLAKVSKKRERDIEDYFVSSGLEVLYDGGKITTAEFHRQVKKALGHNLDLKSFERIWNGIFTANAPVAALIRRLKRSGYRLVLLSNTNEMHSRYLFAKYPVFRLFDRRILSWKEKRRKPDHVLYGTAVRACKARPEEVFYIDDREDLTSEAAELGIVTYTYKCDTPALLRRMKELGIR